MPESVKRRYESPRRREQAETTRSVIRAAAQELFEAQGYAATTMAGVAAAAGVALKTVYLAYETKSGLLRAVWDVLLRGERDQPVSNLAWYREVLDAPDAATALRLNARNSRRGKERIGGILRVIRTGAEVDDEVAALWQLIQTDFHANQHAVVESIAGALREDVTKATDVLWTLNHPDVWHLLVGVRGWTPAQYETWFADTACRELLR
jgi:AcrR family transcriptional regulator